MDSFPISGSPAINSPSSSPKTKSKHHQIDEQKPSPVAMANLSLQFNKPRKPLSLAIFFLPTSFFALSFLLIACNGVGFLCFSVRPAGTVIPVEPKTKPLPSVVEVMREEKPPTMPKSDQNRSLEIPHGEPTVPESNQNRNFSVIQRGEVEKVHYFPSPKRFKPTRKTRQQLRFLQFDARSKMFASRVAEFFSSTSCKDRFFMTWISSLDSFGPRETLSMESVFKFHPKSCLLIVSNSMDSPKGARFLKPFQQRGFKVAAFSPDYTFLFKKTPAERWFRGLLAGAIDPGEVPLGQNISNLLRLAILYKFGGVYIDTDVLILKSLSKLKNAIGAQTTDEGGNWSRLNNAVLVFERAHPLLLEFLKEFASTFDGSKWGHNGPYLVSRVVARVAGKPEFEFTVLPPPAFYPVGWTKIEDLFQRPEGAKHKRWVALKVERIMGESFALHLWNRQSKVVSVEEGSVVGKLMMKCCVFCNSSSSLVPL